MSAQAGRLRAKMAAVGWKEECGHRPQALSLHGSTIISFPLGPGRNKFGPAVVRVRTAKSAVAGDHLLHAHFVGRQTAIVRKGTTRISARAPRHATRMQQVIRVAQVTATAGGNRLRTVAEA